MPVGRADPGFAVNLGQSHDTRVGEIHRGIGVALEQLTNQRKFTSKWCDHESSAFGELDDPAARHAILGHQMTDLGEHGFAGDEFPAVVG